MNRWTSEQVNKRHILSGVKGELFHRSTLFTHLTKVLPFRGGLGEAPRSSFIVHRSSFIVNRSSFIVHRSTFIVHRSTLIVQRSSSTCPPNRPQSGISRFRNKHCGSERFVHFPRFFTLEIYNKTLKVLLYFFAYIFLHIRYF